jgi:hypothetical protein
MGDDVLYYPYFRGKQFELLLLREFAEFLSTHDICPIIEPVKKNLSPLRRCIDSLAEHSTKFVLVVNPQVGEFAKEPGEKQELMDTVAEFPHAAFGIIVNRDSKVDTIKSTIEGLGSRQVSIIHHGSENGKDLAAALADLSNIREHIFIESDTGKLYQRNFRGVRRVLVRNSFKTQKNAAYDESEHFSDLHITYEDEGMDGFGDYLIVGDEYSETGGPAYAIAIHITYLNDESDMFVYHFKSDNNASPVDPAGKFREALSKFVHKYNQDNTKIFRSPACEQFVELHKREHFPGLGKVKQISMQHHIELIAHFLSRN